VAWGLWVWALFLAIAVLAWPFVVRAPRRTWARRAARVAARLWIAGTAVPVVIHGSSRRAVAELPCVLVANHASNLDALVLTAVLPPIFAFVAKSELAGTAWLRLPLRRLGTLFVQRRSAPAGRSQTELAVERLQGGDSLLFFPEGTFGPSPGLLPFHCGGFVAAARTGATVVPVAVRGARRVLPDLARLPRRGQIDVEIGDPSRASRDVDPSAGALELRHRARSFIAARCGEPDLDR
jgi:1-acyl-sn-glycerol-3-phosphate acyltransferase